MLKKTQQAILMYKPHLKKWLHARAVRNVDACSSARCSEALPGGEAARMSKKTRTGGDNVLVPCALDVESIALKCRPTADDIMDLLHELQDDHSGFVSNTSSILQAWKDERLFSLVAIETDDMFNRQVALHEGFCRSSSGRVCLYMFPCFSILSGNNKHKRMRRKGLGLHIINKLEIKETTRQLPGSEKFWEA